MPTYEYRCESCGEEFEKFQSIMAPSAADCPQCGAPAKRLISAGAGLIFKGSGFYITDYKNNKTSGGGNGKSQSSEGKSGESSSSSEGKSGASSSSSEGSKKSSESSSSSSTPSSESKPSSGGKSSSSGSAA